MDKFSVLSYICKNDALDTVITEYDNIDDANAAFIGETQKRKVFRTDLIITQLNEQNGVYFHNTLQSYYRGYTTPEPSKTPQNEKDS